MVEHVRRRASLSKSLSEIYVATCDREIADTVYEHGGEVIMTSNQHKNGTARVAEAVGKIDCSHVILLQGDEPLLLPDHIDKLVNEIANFPQTEAWNITGPINSMVELDRNSFVKCIVTQKADILYCFRRSPCYSDFKTQSVFVRKIMGMIAYRRDFLQKLVEMFPSLVEQAEFIEQMRIIENDYSFKSVSVDESPPSMNEPDDVMQVTEYIKNSDEQQTLLGIILER